MNTFMDKDFLLESEMAKILYHNYAAKMPLVDYHCHLSPQEIYENRRFANLAEAWLGGDHYKWRLMRACGVGEEYISGNAPAWEKFLAFATILPQAMGNPVYHWAHLELQRYFNCHTPLSEKTAQEIWEHCNSLLQNDEKLRVRNIIESSRVKTLCTTDDPADSLEWHQKLRDDASFTTRVLPAFRPDKAINVDKPGFAGYLPVLAQAAGGGPITGIEALKAALVARMDHFDALGCRASDHGVDGVANQPGDASRAERALQNAVLGNPVNPQDAESYKNYLLNFLGEEYARRGWVMEIHFGAMRNTNSKGFAALGADTGYDCINPAGGMAGLAMLLDGLHRRDALPKTLIFSLNPCDNAAINTLAGCFQKPGGKGWVQQGSAWWFNDTLQGMAGQIASFAELMPLGCFVGMLTDSRSFFSYTRHEYFRRILCNILGGWAARGLCPADEAALGKLVEDISYNNAVAYFNLNA